ncbi:Single-strand DNA endonuclease 1-like protein [Drosera capensis]
MGVKNLWDILESCKKTPLHYLQGKRVCIDLSCWMVQLHTVNKSHCSLKEKLYLKGLFHRLRALTALNCCLIFVTDEYILPKIAERDLRRFTKLRCRSKCPVPEIIKPRRLRGRDCYEVLWEGIDGLKTSIVPADLVQSACPERITKYDQRVEEKKQKPRKSKPKQLNDKPPFIMPEIDYKLKTLLLDIESDNQVRYNTAFGTLVAEYITAVTQTVNLVQEEVETHVASKKTWMLGQRSASTWTPQISSRMRWIDLLSPSPQNNKHDVAHCQGICEGIEVVDLCDSDMNISPKHLKKARDLRIMYYVATQSSSTGLFDSNVIGHSVAEVNEINSRVNHEKSVE